MQKKILSTLIVAVFLLCSIASQVFAQSNSSVQPSIIPTNFSNVKSIEPPKNFNPLIATQEQLANNHFPKRQKKRKN